MNKNMIYQGSVTIKNNSTELKAYYITLNKSNYS